MRMPLSNPWSMRYTAAEARGGIAGSRTLDWLRTGVAAQFAYRALEFYGAFLYDKLYRVPSAIDNNFDGTSAGLTVEADYRVRQTWLASIRYDWMDPGGFQSTLAGLDAPRTAQALHLQLRWFLHQGRTRPRSAPGLLAVTLRDSINLAPGGGRHPFRAWRNTILLGIDVAF